MASTSASPAPAAANAAPASATPAPSVLASPFERAVTGTSPYGTNSVYNSTQFATASAASEIAKKIGGQVEELQFAGPISRSTPERVVVDGKGHALNAGLVADLFAKYGDAPGSQAWVVINRDLGITQG